MLTRVRPVDGRFFSLRAVPARDFWWDTTDMISGADTPLALRARAGSQASTHASLADASLDGRRPERATILAKVASLLHNSRAFGQHNTPASI